jgi:hypothetical protein
MIAHHSVPHLRALAATASPHHPASDPRRTIFDLSTRLVFVKLIEFFASVKYWTTRVATFGRRPHLRLTTLPELQSQPLSLSVVSYLLALSVLYCSM